MITFADKQEDPFAIPGFADAYIAWFESLSEDKKNQVRKVVNDALVERGQSHLQAIGEYLEKHD